jgi:hypothetical protein
MTEGELLPRLLIEGSKIGLRIFRNQTGKYELKDGRWLSSGLCEGSSDLIGYVPVTITPAMVGRRVAVFVAVEAKGTTGRTTKARAEKQTLFLDVVRAAGAFGAQVRSCDELRDAFADWLAGR